MPAHIIKNGAFGRDVEESTLLLPPKLREQFPAKLYALLADPRAAPSIAWLPSGLAFRILDEREFVAATIPLYFNQTKLRSFYRQLHLWGFGRQSSGTDGKGAWCHPHFVRGAPAELSRMRRVKIKGAKEARASPATTGAAGAGAAHVVTPSYAPKPSANISVCPLRQAALSALHCRMGRAEAGRPLAASSSEVEWTRCVLTPPPLFNDTLCRASAATPTSCCGDKSIKMTSATAVTVEPLPIHSEVSIDEWAGCIDGMLQILCG